MKKEIVESVMRLFENGKVYLVEDLSISDLSRMMGVPQSEMKADFEKDFGFSFEEMLDIWRLCRARELLADGVPYRLVWKLAGFPSRLRLERLLSGREGLL